MVARLIVQRLLHSLLNTKYTTIFVNSAPRPDKAVGHTYTAVAPSYTGPAQCHLYVCLALTIFAESIIVLNPYWQSPSRTIRCHKNTNTTLGLRLFYCPIIKLLQVKKTTIHKKHLSTKLCQPHGRQYFDSCLNEA